MNRFQNLLIDKREKLNSRTGQFFSWSEKNLVHIWGAPSTDLYVIMERRAPLLHL
jgi:hypothetical protein